MQLIVRAFPIKDSAKQDLDQMIRSLKGERKDEAAAFYRRHGLSHESWHLQETPNGPWVIGISALDDPGGTQARYARATDAFDSWFKSQIGKITGFDLDEQPLGPPTKCIYGWSDERRADAIPINA